MWISLQQLPKDDVPFFVFLLPPRPERPEEQPFISSPHLNHRMYLFCKTLPPYLHTVVVSCALRGAQAVKCLLHKPEDHIKSQARQCAFVTPVLWEAGTGGSQGFAGLPAKLNQSSRFS